MVLRQNKLVPAAAWLAVTCLLAACSTNEKDALSVPPTAPSQQQQAEQNEDATLLIDAESEAPVIPAYKHGYPFKIGNPYTIQGIRYTPKEDPDYDEQGIASWYGPNFHGKYTANGEKYDMNALTAAHRTLPMPSWVEVTNLDNNKRAIVRINDRGPFAKNRILDLSRAAAQQLGVVGPGTARVRVKLVDPPRNTKPTQTAQQGYADPATSGARERLMAKRQFYVQIGAFADRNNARMAADSAAHISPVQLVEAGAQGRPLYRVWLGPMKDKQEAAQTLALARSQGYASAHITTGSGY